MKIVFASTGPTLQSEIDSRLGRAAYLVIWDDKSQEISSLDNRSVSEVAHGAGTLMVQKISGFKPDVFITGNVPGRTALQALKIINVKVYSGANDMTLTEAYQHYKENRLEEVL